MKTCFSCVLLLLHMGAYAQTGMVSRLVASGRDAFTNGGMAPSDSTRFFTSGNNLCDLEQGYQNDSTYQYTYYPAGFTLSTRTINTLCPQGYLNSLQQNISFSTNPTLKNVYLHNYAYLAGGAVMDTLLGWNESNHKWDYLQLCADTFLDPRHIRVHYYSTSGTSGWSPNAKTLHTYTTAGNPDSVLDMDWDISASRWVPNTLLSYTYDATNRIVNQRIQTWDSTAGSWQNISLTTTSYNAIGDTAIQLTYRWDISSNAWVIGMRHIIAYNSLAKPITDIQQYYVGTSQSFINWSRTSYTYNSFGQAVLSATEHWNFLDSAFEFGIQSVVTRYHYETYTPSLAVAPAKPEPTFVLYPNPAHDCFWLDWQGTRVVPVSIQLIDMQGRTVYETSKAAATLHEALPTQQFPTGTYILQFAHDGRAMQRIVQVVH